MSQWFGEPWPSAELRAPVCDDDALRVPTPVGEGCMWCLEEIGAEDRGVVVPCVEMRLGRQVVELRPIHIECHVRSALVPAHLLGTCSCHGVDAPAADDPDLGMTAREASLWVMDWLAVHGRDD